MLMPERLTLSCLYLCPCPCGTCSNTVTRCDPSYRNCGTGNRCSLCLAVSTVACVSVSLCLWPYPCEAFCHQSLQLPLAPVYSAKGAETREHSRQQDEPLHTLCGLGDAGFAVAVSGVILRRRAIFTPSFKASCAEDSQREIVSSHLLRASSNPVTLSGKGTGFRICCSTPNVLVEASGSYQEAAKLQGHSDLHH